MLVTMVSTIQEEKTPPKQFILGYNTPHAFSQIQITDRTSVQSLLRTLLDPLLTHFSPLKARIRVPGYTAVRFDSTASEIEGLCRPLWGLGSLLAGGGEYESTRRWIEGLKAGTDPESPEYWGDPRDNDQRMVEMCPLGFTLAVAPVFWQELSERERENVERWLGNSINEKKYVSSFIHEWILLRMKVYSSLVCGTMRKNGQNCANQSVACLTRIGCGFEYLRIWD
jgi:hypothetical protein